MCPAKSVDHQQKIEAFGGRPLILAEFGGKGAR
jgi:hypothetical protein